MQKKEGGEGGGGGGLMREGVQIVCKIAYVLNGMPLFKSTTGQSIVLTAVSHPLQTGVVSFLYTISLITLFNTYTTTTIIHRFLGQ